MAARVAIALEEEVGRGIPAALSLLGDLTPFFAGRVVAIKPNETWASARDLTACTQADSVAAVIRYVKQFNPGRLVVTGGAGAGETDRIFSHLGIDRVIEAEGVEFIDHNRGPLQKVELGYGPQREVMVCARVFEYETLISLAQHKVHESATVTLTMKNVAMSFPAADYYGHPRTKQAHFHRFFEDLHGFIAGMCQRFPINLGIIVGHPAMTGKGPIGGHTFESGLTLAGTDFVALDTVGAHLLGHPEVRHIREAAALGLGTDDLAAIEVVGLSLEEAARVFRERAGRREALLSEVEV